MHLTHPYMRVARKNSSIIFKVIHFCLGVIHYICRLLIGTIAQLVEQRTENPCVPGSNPGSTTKENEPRHKCAGLFSCYLRNHCASVDFIARGSLKKPGWLYFARTIDK